MINIEWKEVGGIWEFQKKFSATTTRLLAKISSVKFHKSEGECA